MRKREVIVLLLVLTVFYIVHVKAANETVQTQVNAIYNNAPPNLTQNIPDQFIPINFNKTNAFNLNDYFTDFETLSFSLNNTVENVTIAIDSDGSVSFYPDYNFTGIVYVVFTAYDGFNYTNSNNVTVTVGADVEPPLWFTPTIIHQGTFIFQNTFVNFSVRWTDNAALSNFTFFINQGSGFVTSTAEEMTGIENYSRTRTQISLNGGTVYWKVGAYDSSGNYNETEIQNFTVNETAAPSNSGSGTGTGTGTGSDAGSTDRERSSATGFEAGGGGAPRTRGSQAEDFTITPETFNVELKQGSSVTLSLKITNTGTTPLNFTDSLIDLEQFSPELSMTEFNLSAGESRTISLQLQAPENLFPEIYFGKIEVKASNLTKQAHIAVTVKPLVTNLDLDVSVLPKYKQVKREKPVIANLTVKSLGDLKSKTLTLYYALIDYEGNVLNSQTEDLELTENQMTFEKQLNVPSNAPQGEYIFFARVSNADDVALDSDTFYAGTRFDVLSFIKTNLLILLIVIASIIVAILMVRHRRNQERLRLLNLYILITQLKKLLADENLEDAIKLYVRIKSTYGQPLSRTAMNDKEELKKEMKILTEKLQNPELIAKAEAHIAQQEKTKEPETKKPEEKTETKAKEPKEKTETKAKEPKEQTETKIEEPQKQTEEKPLEEKKTEPIPEIKETPQPVTQSETKEKPKEEKEKKTKKTKESVKKITKQKEVKDEKK